jgi:hypothetical protein
MTEERRGRIKRSQAQERRIAKSYGGSLNSGSGNGTFRKNDVRSERFLHEAKRTDNKASITIRRTDLRDLTRNALMEGRIPVLHFQIDKDEYVILTEADFQEMTGDAQ